MLRVAAAVVLAASLAMQSPGASTTVVQPVPDLTIRTRVTTEPPLPGSPSVSRIQYFKGALQRQESILDGKPAPFIVVNRCDDRQTVLLNSQARTYSEGPLTDISASFSRTRLVAQDDSLASVHIRSTITTTTRDTCERRAVGPYTARHVRTVRRTVFDDGAVRAEDRDGWYIDLPVDCHDWAELLEMWDTTPLVPGRRLIRRGDGRRGYPIIETVRSPDSTFVNGVAVTVTTTQELVEVSEQPLDAALFAIPAGYRPALRTPGGGSDMTRPDTAFNRAVAYYQMLVAWTNRLLH